MTNKVTGLRLSNDAVDILRRRSFEGRVSMSAIVDYLIIYNLKDLPPFDPYFGACRSETTEAEENTSESE